MYWHIVVDGVEWRLIFTALDFILILHTFTSTTGIALTPLRYNHHLGTTVSIGILTFATMILTHELLILLVILLLLISLAHNRILLLKRVVIATLKLSCVVITTV